MIFILIFFTFLGCDSTENECSDKFCGEPKIQNLGLNLTFLGHNLETPKAKYVLLFKLDKDSNNLKTPLVGLKNDSITFLDNGDKQSEFESDDKLSPDPGSFAFDILLLIDLSGSITKASALPILKDAITTFVRTSKSNSSSSSGEINIGIKYFDGDPGIPTIIDFTSDTSKLIKAIAGIDSTLNDDKSTNLHGAIVEGSESIINRVKNSKKLANVGTIIVFTDGKDQANIVNNLVALDKVKTLKNNKINIYTIGLGGEIDQSSLKEFGIDGFYFANDINKLIPTFKNVAFELNQEVNSYYKLEYCTPRRANNVNLDITIHFGSNYSLLAICLNGDCIKDDCR